MYTTVQHSTAQRTWGGGPPSRRSRRVPWPLMQPRSPDSKLHSQHVATKPKVARAHACAEYPSNVNSRVNAIRARERKAIRTLPSILPKGRQSLISAPSCYKTCNLCRWESQSTPPRAHTRARTQLPKDRCPALSSPPQPPSTTSSCPPAQAKSSLFFFFSTHFSSLPPLPLRRRGTQDREGSTPPRARGCLAY